MRIQNISNTSFSAAPGNYLNPHAYEQKAALKTLLRDSFEKESNVVKAMDKSIKQIFPYMNFHLVSIDSIRNNPVIQKQKPLMEILTYYRDDDILTYMFMNGQKMLGILNDDEDEDIYGSAKADKMADEIAENVVLANEPYFITRVVRDFTERLFVQDEVTPETVNNSVRESLVKYDIDVDNKVVSSDSFNPQNQQASKRINNMVGIKYTPKNVESTMYVNENTGDNIRYSAIPQNFANVLCANSKMFNTVKIALSEGKINPEIMVDWSSLFVQIELQHPDFLKKPAEFKQDVYMSAIRGILTSFDMSVREDVFKQILNQTAQETLAYALAPNILHFTDNKKYVPLEEYFKDFHEFINAINFTDYMI